MPPPPHLRARKPACKPHLIWGRLRVRQQGIQRPPFDRLPVRPLLLLRRLAVVPIDLADKVGAH